MSEETLEPSPAARTIEAMRVRRQTSVRRAAASAGLSEGRWRQIAKGYQLAARGSRIPVNAPTETLARMATAVGLRSDDMRQAGHAAVADAMHDLKTAREGRGVLLDMDLYQEALTALEQWRDEIGEDEEAPVHPPAAALWLWTPRQLAENLAAQVALLESAHDDAMRSYFTELRKGKQWPPPDQNAVQEAPSDNAATTRQAGGSPAARADELNAAVRAAFPETSVTPDGVALAARTGPNRGKATRAAQDAAAEAPDQ